MTYYIFDGGTPSTNFSEGPAFNCGGPGVTGNIGPSGAYNGANIVLQLRHGNANEWPPVNPVLAVGELGYEIDTGQFKIGNGNTGWNSLPYGGLRGPTGPSSDSGTGGQTGPTGLPGFATTLTPSTTGVIPVMTGYTTGGFTISASSEFSASYPAWYACDGSPSTDWAQVGTAPVTWQVQCPSPIAIWQIQISKRANPEYYSTFYFEASPNGGTSWVTLLYSSGALNSIGSSPSLLTLPVVDPTYTPYSLYRIRATAVGAGTVNGGMAIFQMYSYTQANTTATGATGQRGQTGQTGATGPANFAYNGFLFTGSSPLTLTSAQSGYLIQISSNVILPLGSSVPLGGIISFTNNTTSSFTITVNNVATEFIYNGNGIPFNTRSITIQGGETLSLVSRGSIEWDVSGGSTGMRYQLTPPVLRSSIVNQAATTLVSLNTIRAYMSSAGAMWLGTNTGTAINVYGQATLVYFGSGPGASTITLTSLTSMTNAVAAANAGHIGDMMVAVVTDTTNGYMYRITSQQYTTSQSGNYNLVIEQLG